jgi:hypothetical protein
MSIRFKTPKFRASFCNVFEPKSFGDGKPKYSISMIFDPKFKDEIQEAIDQEVKNAWGDKPPKKYKSPLRDGDEKEDEAYIGNIFMNSNSKDAPGVVGRDLSELYDKEDFDSGDYARASVSFAAYDFKGTKGIGCYLHNIQKLEDGERFVGRVKASSDFDSVEDDGMADLI